MSFSKPIESLNEQHGIKFQQAPKGWVEEPIILVFEQMTSEWYNAPVNQLLSSVGKQGGLHPIRQQYTYKIWTFEASSLQVYFVRLLSHTPHYAIRWKDWAAFQRHLKEGNYHHEHIPQGKSFVPLPSNNETKEDDKPFLAVFNHETEEMDKGMVDIIEEMNLVSTFDLLAGVEADESRGNVQKSYGFSPVGHKRRPDNNFIPEPQPLKGNDDERVKQKFYAHSQLRVYASEKYPGIKEMLGEPEDEKLASNRKRDFAQSIHPDNIVDCMTIGLNEIAATGTTTLGTTTIKAYDINPGANLLLLCHVDSGNDSTLGNQVQCVCSGVFAAFEEEVQIEEVFRNGSKKKDGSINSFYRSWNGSYNKDACSLSTNRQRWMSIFMAVVEKYVTSQAAWRRSLISTLQEMSKEARVAFLNRIDFIQFQRSFTKKIMLGTVHDCIRSLHARFHLCKHQAFELCVAVIFITSPVTYNDILRKWEKDGKLPDGSLIVAFHDTGRELAETGAMAACRGGRYIHQSLFSTPCDVSVLEEGCRQVWPYLDIWETWDDFAPREAPAIFRRICNIVQGSIFNAGPLKTQELVQLLIRLDLIPIPFLADQAFINDGSKTRDRLVALLSEKQPDSDEEPLYTREDALKITLSKNGYMDQFLLTMSKKFDFSIETAENMLCKCLTETQGKKKGGSYEAIVLDRHLWDFRRIPGRKGQSRDCFQILKIDPLKPDGPHAEYPLAVWRPMDESMVAQGEHWCLSKLPIVNRGIILQGSNNEQKRPTRHEFKSTIDKLDSKARFDDRNGWITKPKRGTYTKEVVEQDYHDDERSGSVQQSKNVHDQSLANKERMFQSTGVWPTCWGAYSKEDCIDMEFSLGPTLEAAEASATLDQVGLDDVSTEVMNLFFPNMSTTNTNSNNDGVIDYPTVAAAMGIAPAPEIVHVAVEAKTAANVAKASNEATVDVEAMVPRARNAIEETFFIADPNHQTKSDHQINDQIDDLDSDSVIADPNYNPSETDSEDSEPPPVKDRKKRRRTTATNGVESAATKKAKKGLTAALRKVEKDSVAADMLTRQANDTKTKLDTGAALLKNLQLARLEAIQRTKVIDTRIRMEKKIVSTMARQSRKVMTAALRAQAKVHTSKAMATSATALFHSTMAEMSEVAAAASSAKKKAQVAAKAHMAEKDAEAETAKADVVAKAVAATFSTTTKAEVVANGVMLDVEAEVAKAAILAKAMAVAFPTKKKAEAADKVTEAETARFPIGTRFIKEFPGYGRFEGHVVDFDGKHYEVHYPEDGDWEVILESELEKVEILAVVTEVMTTTGHCINAPAQANAAEAKTATIDIVANAVAPSVDDQAAAEGVMGVVAASLAGAKACEAETTTVYVAAKAVVPSLDDKAAEGVMGVVTASLAGAGEAAALTPTVRWAPSKNAAATAMFDIAANTVASPLADKAAAEGVMGVVAASLAGAKAGEAETATVDIAAKAASLARAGEAADLTPTIRRAPSKNAAATATFDIAANTVASPLADKAASAEGVMGVVAASLAGAKAGEAETATVDIAAKAASLAGAGEAAALTPTIRRAPSKNGAATATFDISANAVASPLADKAAAEGVMGVVSASLAGAKAGEAETATVDIEANAVVPSLDDKAAEGVMGVVAASLAGAGEAEALTPSIRRVRFHDIGEETMPFSCPLVTQELLTDLVYWPGDRRGMMNTISNMIQKKCPITTKFIESGSYVVLSPQHPGELSFDLDGYPNQSSASTQYHSTNQSSLSHFNNDYNIKNWIAAGQLFEPEAWTTGVHVKQSIPNGIITFANNKKGKQKAKVILLLHSWLYPPIPKGTTSLLWEPAVPLDPELPPHKVMERNSPAGLIVGYSYYDNIILVRYSVGRGTHYLIYNTHCREKTSSSWYCLPGRN